MDNSTHSIAGHLVAHGIKPSAQRVAILRYLKEHPVHPTAETIHSALVDDMPMLSRTTVYNTLWLMAERGAISVIAIDRNNARFDYDCTPHAHFLCSGCGEIFDLRYPPRVWDEIPEGFKLEFTHIYHTGLCPKCFKKSKQN
jgi:Fur family ferric uptake transcriptional regulator/Fur family peroxide stress response transcriptional regulator